MIYLEVTLDSYNAALAAARADGETAGRIAERQRVQAILDSDAAKGREALARHFAFEMDMSVENATAALEKVPRSRKLELVPDADPISAAQPAPAG